MVLDPADHQIIRNVSGDLLRGSFREQVDKLDSHFPSLKMKDLPGYKAALKGC